MNVLAGFNSADTLYNTEEEAVSAAILCNMRHDFSVTKPKVYEFSYATQEPNRLGILGIVSSGSREAFSIHNCGGMFVYDAII